MKGSPRDELRDLLGSLCSTDEDRKILDALCEAVTEGSDDSFSFEDGEFSYVRGGEVPYNPAVPKSFSEIASAVKDLGWDGGGPEVGFGLTADGLPMADDEGFSFLKDDDTENYERLKAAGGADAAFSYGQNWTFFDPTRTLSNGEPALGFVSHESVEWEEVKSADELDYKQIFLRMISDAMVGTDYVPELYC